MTVLQKLKLLIECNEWFDENESYAEMLMKVVIELPGYPKVERDGDTSQEIRYVVQENYNEEKYELLDLENFNIISADNEEVVICAGGDWQAPLTFSIKANENNGKLSIVDIYPNYGEGLTFEEFDDLLINL